MFTIGNVEKNRQFNAWAAPVDPTSPLYKELVAKYHYMRDPLVPMADDVEFHDFIRSKIMEKALRAKQKEEEEEKEEKNESAGPASGRSNSNNNDDDEEEGGSGDAIAPQRSTQEPKKETGQSFKNYFRFFCY